MQGYHGVVLRVNLSEPKIVKEPLREELVHSYAGGRGLNSRVLYDEVKPGIDPLGPDNKIIVGVGPCNGTIVPGSQRFTVTSKSPLTGLFGDSNSGASFGAQLKYAGYDQIIIEGQSKEPVCLRIDDDRVELKPAGDLWGRTTRETERVLMREFGDPDACVISIGPGGENLVRFANLIGDFGRGLGRTGQGAVFGSKKLKAIIVRGSRGVTSADPKALHEAVRQTHEAWGKNLKLKEARARFGPGMGWLRYDAFGMFPTRNYQSGRFHKSLLEGLDNYFVKQKACFSCPQGCDHMFVVSEGPFSGAYGCGVELSHLLDFGSKIGCGDLPSIFKASELCDHYGLDYFDMTSTIAYAMECFERGILTAEETDGLALEWGNANAILNLIEMTAQKKKLGSILAQGMREASRMIGEDSEKYAMQAKGQSLVERDPRASKGWGLAYAVSSRGPCHVRAYLPEGYPAENWDIAVKKILEKYKDPTNPLLEEGKGELVAWHENLQAFKNSMEICLFSLYPWMFSVPPMLVKYFNAVTGFDISEDELLRIGERIINIERAFNVREGLTRADDTLPERMLKEPMPDGPGKGEVVRLDSMLDDYYHHRGWDKESGIPTEEKLLELGLPDVVDELKRLGKLPTSKKK
jgi:aldehyde:ferredoxin oxidoreductase